MASKEETYLGIVQLVARGSEGERRSAYNRAVEFQSKYANIHENARKLAAKNKLEFPPFLGLMEAVTAAQAAAAKYSASSPLLRAKKAEFSESVGTEIMAMLVADKLYLVTKSQLEDIVRPILTKVAREPRFKLKEEGVGDFDAAARSRRPSERATATPYSQESSQEQYFEQKAQAEGVSKNLAALSDRALESMPAPYKDVMLLFLKRREEIEAEEEQQLILGKKVKKKPLLQFTARELSQQTGMSKPECERLIAESFIVFQSRLAELLKEAELATKTGARWRRL